MRTITIERVLFQGVHHLVVTPLRITISKLNVHVLMCCKISIKWYILWYKSISWPSSSKHSAMAPSSATPVNFSQPQSLPSSPNFSFSHITHLITIKFIRENYLLWHTQLVPYLKGHNLFGFVDGSQAHPSPMVSKVDSNANAPVLSLNPTYFPWKQQDQLLLLTIISSLLDDDLAHCYWLWYFTRCLVSS